MNKNQAMAFLSDNNISFNANASASDLVALATREQERINLEKLIPSEGFSFGSDTFQKKVKEQKEREFPDYGRDVPAGEYTFTGAGTYKSWKSPKTGNEIQILVAYLEKGGNIFEVAAAAFAAAEYEFVSFDGKDDKGNIKYKKVEMNPILDYYSSVADRNGAMSTIEAGTKVKVFHSTKGHFNNPYNTRIWDFVRTWVELA
jgi:hypothetical protein